MFGCPVVKGQIYLFTLFSESRLVKLVYLRNIKLMSLLDLTFSYVTLLNSPAIINKLWLTDLGFLW